MFGDIKPPTKPNASLMQMIKRAHRWNKKILLDNNQELSAIAAPPWLAAKHKQVSALAECALMGRG
jgi:hypothetical protein